MSSETLYDVTNGPSREELFDALRLRHEGRKAIFTYKSGLLTVRKEFTIDMIQGEDGSGNSWNLLVRNPHLGRVKMYYHSHKRTGMIRE